MQVVSNTKLSIPLREINVDTPNRHEILKNGLNRTRKENILGRGSFGTVIKAVYKGKQVAVKIIKTWNKSQMFTIKNESNILGWQHKNIIEILKIDSTPTYSIIIMARFPGQCLQFILDQIQISLQHRICIILDILNGLNYCHQNGVLHLDIKPQNILITYDQSISVSKKKSNYVCKICDFGSSIKINGSKNYDNIQTQGTIRYMSPEMLKNQTLTPKTDIYSLGITMWQIKTNIYPYSLIDCNETVAYKVVKENFRPDSCCNQSKSLTTKQLNISKDHEQCFCEHFTSELTNNALENIESLLHSEDLKLFSPFKSRKQVLGINNFEVLRKSPLKLRNENKVPKFSNNSLDNLLNSEDLQMLSSFQKREQNLGNSLFISPFKVRNERKKCEFSNNLVENIENTLNSEDLRVISPFRKSEQFLNMKNFEILVKSPLKIKNQNKLPIQKSLFKESMHKTKKIASNICCNSENTTNICLSKNNCELNLKTIFMNNNENIFKNLEIQYDKIYKMCWNSDPIKRPTCQSLIKQFNKMLKEI